MSATLKFYINWFAKQMQISPTSGSTFTPTPFFQADVIPVQVQLLEPSPSGGANSFVFPDISNMSLEATMGALPVGNVADAPFMTQYVWVKDIVNNNFTASFDFTSSLVDTFLGALPTKPAFLQFAILEGTTKYTIWGNVVTLNATALKVTTPSALPAGQIPLSLQDAQQRFPGFLMLPGQTITMLSPDGGHQRILGVNNDGTGLDDVV